MLIRHKEILCDIQKEEVGPNKHNIDSQNYVNFSPYRNQALTP